MVCQMFCLPNTIFFPLFFTNLLRCIDDFPTIDQHGSDETVSLEAALKYKKNIDKAIEYISSQQNNTKATSNLNCTKYEHI